MGRVVAEPRRGRETATLAVPFLWTEDDLVKEEPEADEFADNSITEEELLSAVRRSFQFLSACVDGEIADAKVADRIVAARTPRARGQGAVFVRRAVDRGGRPKRRRHRLDRHRVGVRRRPATNPHPLPPPRHAQRAPGTRYPAQRTGGEGRPRDRPTVVLSNLSSREPGMLLNLSIRMFVIGWRAAWLSAYHPDSGFRTCRQRVSKNAPDGRTARSCGSVTGWHRGTVRIRSTPG